MKTIRTLIVVCLSVVALNCLGQPAGVHPPGLTNRISPDETGFLLPGAWTNGLAVVPRVVQGPPTDHRDPSGPEGQGGVEPLRSAPGCATVPGVVGWWPGEGTALDALGLNNGTAYSVGFAAGKVDYAFNLNGSSAYVDVPNASILNPSAAVTVEAWVYPTPPLDQVAAPIVKKAGEGLGTDHGYSLELWGPNSVAFWVFLNGYGWTPSFAVSLPANQWSHVAGVYDGSSVRLYLNGNSVGNPTYASSFIVSSGNHLQIGHDPSNPLRYFHGQIDEPSVYNTALSAGQILAIYNAGSVGKCLGPVIVTQPQSQQVLPGANVTLSVVAGGLPTLSYQWYRNGTIRAGATASTLTLPNVQATDAGTYNAVVSNPYGTVTSDNAVLTVYLSSCVQPPTGLVGWWAGEGNANDSLGVNNGTYQGVWTYGAGTVGQAFDLDGSSRYVDIGNGAGLSPTAAITVEGWIYPRLPLDPVGPPVLKKAGGGGYWGQDNGYSLELAGSSGVWFWLFLDGGRGWTASPIAPLSTYCWSHVAGVYDGATISIYVNGVLRGTHTAVSGQIVPSSHNLQIGHDPSNPRYFNGLIDEASLYNRALSASEIQAIYAAGAAGKCLALTPFEAWLQHYFGAVFGTDPNAAPNADPDYDGRTNLQEYGDGTDPNVITFQTSIASDHVNTSSVSGTIEVDHGIAAQMAVLVNPTDFTSAQWTTYTPTSPTFTAPLPATEGKNEVWVGLRGLATDAEQTWVRSVVTRDTTQPTVMITDPAPGTITRPIIQLQGYSTEPLSSITFDLINAAGTAAGQRGSVTGQYFDAVAGSITTNWFECTDVELTTGQNLIILRLTDLAGNVTTTSLLYTFDTSGVVAGPALTLYWPQNEDAIAESSFTLRGWADDPTAQVFASITGADGVTTTVEATVERNGLFWAEDLPLAGGASTLTLNATNAAGKPTTTTITVTKSAVQLTMDDLPETESSYISSISGSINTAGYQVWVNGRQASVNGLNWTANQIFLPEGGTALVQVRAIPSAENVSGSGQTPTYQSPANPNSPNAATAEVQKNKPARIIVLSSFHSLASQWQTIGEGDHETSGADSTTVPWRRNGETHGTVTHEGHTFSQGAWDNVSSVMTQVWPPCLGEGDCLDCGVWTTVTTHNGVTTTTTGPGLTPTGPIMVYRKDAGRHILSDWAEADSHNDEAVVVLQTGGKGKSKRQSLFTITASATEYLVPWLPDQLRPIASTDIVVGDVGRLGSDGLLHVDIADNTTRDVTVKTSKKAYAFTVTQQKHRLFVQIGNYLLEQDRVRPLAHYCVGQKLNCEAVLTPPVPGLVSANPRWNFAGQYVNDHYTADSGCEIYQIAPFWVVQNPTRVWYCRDGKGLTAFAGLFCTFNNGQTAYPTARGKFDMYRPQLLPLGGVSPGTLSVDTFVGSVYWLHDGALNQGGTGFATWVASDYPGTAGYTQVYDDESYPTAYGSNVLDGAEFYTHPGPPQITVHLGQPSLNPLALVDAPSETSRPGGSVALVVQFRDYARFRPDAGNPADNIFVTLGKVTWNINGSATGGVLNGGSTISQPTLDDSSEWPFWTTTKRE